MKILLYTVVAVVSVITYFAYTVLTFPFLMTGNH